MIIAETERLFLSKITLLDAPFLFELMNTQGWLKYIWDRSIRSVDDAESYISDRIIKSYDENGYGFYVVIHKKQDLKLGICGLINRTELNTLEVGFAFLPKYGGKGFAYESAMACLNLARDSFDFEKIGAVTKLNNYRSIQLLKRLGLKYQKMVSLAKENLAYYELDFSDIKPIP